MSAQHVTCHDYVDLRGRLFKCIAMELQDDIVLEIGVFLFGNLCTDDATIDSLPKRWLCSRLRACHDVCARAPAAKRNIRSTSPGRRLLCWSLADRLPETPLQLLGPK